MVVAIMFPCGSELDKIEKMIKNDAAFERSQTFANSVFFDMETLGKSTFSFLSVIHDYESLKMKRTHKSEVTAVQNPDIKFNTIITQKVHYGKPPEDFKNISNADISTSSIINVPLWNISEWKGVWFMAHPQHALPPVLSFMFSKPAGKGIFEDWSKDIGMSDKENAIGIRIIKGIDKKNPFWYRIAIGQQGLPDDHHNEPQIIPIPVRCHTMQPNNDANLKMFERELNIVKSFLYVRHICLTLHRNLNFIKS